VSEPETPADAVRRAIDASGPIGFDRFMELALYGPGGYYERPPIGADGDFITSPHVHAVFAELLARAIEEMRSLLGDPDPLRVTEVGAGDGTLARALLPHLAGPVRYTAVERSPGGRDACAEIAGVSVLDRMPDETADVTIANELLDNLPFRLVRDGREVRVGVDDDGRLTEVLADAGADGDLSVDRADGIDPIGAMAFVDDLARRLVAAGLAGAPGYALLIDYGGAGEAGGPVHGYAGHRIVDDVLDDPGGADITAGVDMALLATRAAAQGAVAFGDVSQRAALAALGFEAWFRAELASQHRQLETGDGVGAVRTWSAKSRATLLADPGGLGRFRWLLLASPDLAAPPWWGRASDQ
jgi:NADH dehydrogenase [ubiquinone] 1 alpha subcomplex assembly factor 7